MPRLKLEDDPVYKRLLWLYDRAVREHKKTMVALRRYYLNSDELDVTKAALLQQAAHNAEHVLSEASSNLTKFAWELVPHSKDPDHLEYIMCAKIAAKERIAASPRKEIPTQVMIVTRINDGSESI